MPDVLGVLCDMDYLAEKHSWYELVVHGSWWSIDGVPVDKPQF